VTRNEAARWRRATRCVSEDNCVEYTGLVASGAVGLRSSLEPETTLEFTQVAWHGFVRMIKEGQFDGPGVR
jgi:hypothetical protein